MVCVPRAANYRLHGIPFGWSRVVPLAEEATATSAPNVTPREPLRPVGRFFSSVIRWWFSPDSPRKRAVAMEEGYKPEGSPCAGAYNHRPSGHHLVLGNPSHEESPCSIA
ncbi:hypothetical protein GCM10018952_63240 [Streptosporangium vulgare]